MTNNTIGQQDNGDALDLLVVDDSAVARQMIIKVLRMCPMPLGTIHEASNGQEALDLLEEAWVDMVLADISMPVMDGNEMIRRIRNNPGWSDLPIIIISSNGDLRQLEKVAHHGLRHIQKPFTPETLYETILQTQEEQYV